MNFAITDLDVLPTHVVVVLLQEDKLFPDSFNLTLDIYPGHVGVIYEFLQSANVGLHRLTDCHLIVKPVTDASCYSHRGLLLTLQNGVTGVS